MTSKTTMVLEINELKAKLKAKDEKFINILDELHETRDRNNSLVNIKLGDYFTTNSVEMLKNKIKQRIKEE